VELLRYLGFIEPEIEKEVTQARELLQILGGQSSKKNCLILLCQVEKIYLTWMSGEKKVEEPSSEEHKAEPKESHPVSHGRVNEEGNFVLSL
jgi:hypothetical protein